MSTADATTKIQAVMRGHLGRRAELLRLLEESEASLLASQQEQLDQGMALIEGAQRAKEDGDRLILGRYAQFIDTAAKEGLMTFSALDDSELHPELQDLLHRLSCVLHLSHERGSMSIHEQFNVFGASCGGLGRVGRGGLVEVVGGASRGGGRAAGGRRSGGRVQSRRAVAWVGSWWLVCMCACIG